jgi:hypothetical protein
VSFPDHTGPRRPTESVIGRFRQALEQPKTVADHILDFLNS